MFRRDIERLEAVLPDNPDWRGKESSGVPDNVRYLGLEQARALYDAVIARYVEKRISGDLQTVFHELIEFFEKSLGFSTSPAQREVISRAQAERRRKEEETRAARRAEALATCEQLGALKNPTTPAIGSMLADKLAEYRKRLAIWHLLPSEFAFVSDPDFRDTVFKILVVEAVLGASGPVLLTDLLKAVFEKHGDVFDPAEFFSVCGIISLYLGTPLPGCEHATTVKRPI